MDGSPDLSTPVRDPRYARRRLEVQRLDGGGWLLRNPAPYETRFTDVIAPLVHWAAAEPARVWLAERSGEGWRTVGYGEALQRVRVLAGGLAGLGLGQGDALLILARNGIDHALVAYAAMSLGAVAAPVSPQYGAPGADPSRLAHALERLCPAAVYVEDGGTIAHAADQFAGLPVIAARNAQPGQHALAELERSETVSAVVPLAPVRAAKLLLTSGSTGRPKAVIQTHSNIALNSAQITACFDDPEPPVIVNAAPWSHSLGANAILHMTLHRGGTLYIDGGQPTPERFSETVRNLSEVSPTYHNMVPAGWALLADALERDAGLARTFFARVRLLQYGGAAMAQSLVDRVQAVALATVGERISFASGYGATETGPTACNVHWPNFRTGMLGLPVPGTELKLAPVEGGKLEARIRGPQVSPGYLNDPALTAAAFDEDGFYKLGDAARLVDEGRPEAGVAFDGRLVENFKLASGTFVAAGVLRTDVVSACGGAVLDAVVCGEGRASVGLLLFANPGFEGDVAAAVREGLARLNARGRGGAGRVARALILPDAPDPGSGEITDKGYINQGLARTRRAADIDRLYADPPGAGVMTFE